MNKKNVKTLYLAPTGPAIFQSIATPEFITIFFEEIPGATGWVVEIYNTIDDTTIFRNVPEDVPANTYNVAVYVLIFSFFYSHTCYIDCEYFILSDLILWVTLILFEYC